MDISEEMEINISPQIQTCSIHLFCNCHMEILNTWSKNCIQVIIILHLSICLEKILSSAVLKDIRRISRILEFAKNLENIYPFGLT